MKTAFLLLCGILFAGCKSTLPIDAANAGDPPVRYTRNVQVAIYDSVARPRSSALTTITLDQAEKRPHKVIALLTVIGKAQDEGLLQNAFAWHARQLGADALVPLKADAPYTAWNASSNERAQRIFRAQAITFNK